MSKEVYIIDGVRTAIGNLGGALSSVRADDLAAHVIKGLVEKQFGINPELIEDIILGCANQAGTWRQMVMYYTKQKNCWSRHLRRQLTRLITES
jgi:acetyl-CoA acetyltransferase